MNAEARRALEELLLRLFSAGELRMFLWRTRGRPVMAELPDAGVSPYQLTFVAVGLLDRHGLLDEDFFRSLCDERPRRRADILRVQALFQRREGLDQVVVNQASTVGQQINIMGGATLLFEPARPKVTTRTAESAQQHFAKGRLALSAADLSTASEEFAAALTIWEQLDLRLPAAKAAGALAVVAQDLGRSGGVEDALRIARSLLEPSQQGWLDALERQLHPSTAQAPDLLAAHQVDSLHLPDAALHTWLTQRQAESPPAFDAKLTDSLRVLCAGEHEATTLRAQLISTPPEKAP